MNTGKIPSYFSDNVRDDYAAGQLDAQVWSFLFLTSVVRLNNRRLKMCFKKCASSQSVVAINEDIPTVLSRESCLHLNKLLANFRTSNGLDKIGLQDIIYTLLHRHNVRVVFVAN